LGILLLLVVSVAGMLSYVKIALPNVADAPDLSIELTPERLERGEYLALYVSGCIECHSQRDYSIFSGPVVSGTEGAGGHPFTREMGLPGNYVPSNITPFSLEEWTDGEIFRAVTSGVDKDGKALFPVMPYHYYGKMDREDIFSIIAYIRSLDPIESVLPDSESDFPMNFIINLMPEDAVFSELPDTSDHVNYGEYLASAGGCIHCHTTQDDRGMIIPEMLMAGGNENIIPTGGIVRSSNLTPDEGTGIGRWTEDAFVMRIKAYADSTVKMPAIHPGDFNSLMSWSLHSKMTEQDLRSIYRYLKTLEPIKNKVEKFTSE
jgi:mono/diheme cytochrome c family protein